MLEADALLAAWGSCLCLDHWDLGNVTSWVAPQAVCLSPGSGMKKVENKWEEEENRKLGRLGSKTCCSCLCGKCPTAGCQVSFLPLIRLFFINLMLLQHPCSEFDKQSHLFEEKFPLAARPGWAGYQNLPAMCFTCRCRAEKFGAKRVCSAVSRLFPAGRGSAHHTRSLWLAEAKWLKVLLRHRFSAFVLLQSPACVRCACRSRSAGCVTAEVAEALTTTA